MNAIITQENTSLAISQAQHEILTQSTPREEIRNRKGRGGRSFSYTDPAYVIRTLNLAFGWDWDFEADHEEIVYIGERPFEARCRGRLTVRMDGRAITKTQFGCQPIEFLQDGSTPVSLGDAYKGAASDAMKKCASLLGIALDLYDSDSEVNTGKPAPQPAAQRQPVVVEQVKPANGFDSPQAIIDAANIAAGQKYYTAPAHAFNALRQELGSKWNWPRPGDKAGWQEAYEFLVFHAKTQLESKAA